MRSTLLAATTTTVLALGLLAPPGAQAAASSYVITGHPITAAPGMALIGDSCTTSGATPPTVNNLERVGGTLGSSALGWSVTQSGFEAGPVATLAGNPDYLNAYYLDVLAESGTTGHAYARINWDADTWYIGWSSVSVPAGGWRTLDLVNRSYYWTMYDAGSVTDVGTYTVQQFVTGPGFQAISLGVLLGCGGQPFYVDRMAVSNAENSVGYDFERKPPPPPPPPEHLMSHLEWSTDGKTVQTGSAITIRYGQRLWMLGHGHLHSTAGARWITGAGTLTEEPTGGGAKSYRGTFDPRYYAAFKVDPKETTTYQFAADPYQGVGGDPSGFVTVNVQSRIGARIADRSLVQGQRLVVKGKIRPGDRRVPVRLQRKVRGRWVNLATTRTAKKGRFTLSARARTTGRWKVRVKSGTTQSNLGAWTRSATVQVKRYVPPPKHTPPHPDPVVHPTTVSTPPPPKVTNTAPTPPDRPTPTGRVSSGTVSTAAVDASGAKP